MNGTIILNPAPMNGRQLRAAHVFRSQDALHHQKVGGPVAHERIAPNPKTMPVQ